MYKIVKYLYLQIFFNQMRGSFDAHVFNFLTLSKTFLADKGNPIKITHEIFLNCRSHYGKKMAVLVLSSVEVTMMNLQGKGRLQLFMFHPKDQLLTKAP